MVDVDEAPATAERAKLVLAAAHAEGLGRVVFFEPAMPRDGVVRLLEVSDEFPEAAVPRAGAGGLVVPVFPMGPSPDFPFRSEVAQVTPGEWSDLRAGHLRLGRDWGDLTLAREVELDE